MEGPEHHWAYAHRQYHGGYRQRRCRCLRLSTLNQNVLFELGYAIGKSKRTWISLNTSLRDAESDYKKLGSTLVPIGFSQYRNYQELSAELYRTVPWQDSDIASIPLGASLQDRERSAPHCCT